MNRGTHTTLAGPRRCPWCGHRATWRDRWTMRRWGTCRNCADLEQLAREAVGRPMRDELREAVKRR